MNIKIYDNGGETCDRYLVVIEEDVYTMSWDARSPAGVNQWAGNVEDFPEFMGMAEIELNSEVLKAILARCEEE